MTYHKEEYTLHNGKKIYAEYNEYNICQVTKECMEMLLDLYQQGRADAIDEFVKRLKAECRKHYVDCDPYFGGIVDSILYEDDIDEIAELLKERKE